MRNLDSYLSAFDVFPLPKFPRYTPKIFINQKIFKKYNFLFKEINEPKMQNSFKKKSLYSEFFLRPARKIRLEDLGGTRGTRETRMETGEKGGKRKAWVWKRVVWMQ